MTDPQQNAEQRIAEIAAPSKQYASIIRHFCAPECDPTLVGFAEMCFDSGHKYGYVEGGATMTAALERGINGEPGIYPDWVMRVREELSALRAANAKMMEAQPVFAWLIEHRDSPAGKPLYFTGKRIRALQWSEHIQDACRFAREQDATLLSVFISEPYPQHPVCEHGWDAPALSSEPSP